MSKDKDTNEKKRTADERRKIKRQRLNSRTQFHYEKFCELARYSYIASIQLQWDQ